jgi:hypothetical protein
LGLFVLFIKSNINGIRRFSVTLSSPGAGNDCERAVSGKHETRHVARLLLEDYRNQLKIVYCLFRLGFRIDFLAKTRLQPVDSDTKRATWRVCFCTCC